MADKDENVYIARLAEQAERYDGKRCFIDVLKCISFLCEESKPISAIFSE